jgi:hypothetical protein
MTRRERGQLPKAYLRTDPNIDRHTDAVLVAIMRLQCAANRQDPRGRFETWDNVVTALGRHAATAKRFLDEQHDGSWVVRNWDLWQEGDLNVGERMRRLRERKRHRNSGVTTTVTAAVTQPSQNRISPSEASGVRRQDVPSELQSVVVQDPEGTTTTTGEDPQPPTSWPRTCPGCGQRSLWIGTEGDHTFCGRGGACPKGTRFDLDGRPQRRPAVGAGDPAARADTTESRAATVMAWINSGPGLDERALEFGRWLRLKQQPDATGAELLDLGEAWEAQAGAPAGTWPELLRRWRELVAVEA